MNPYLIISDPHYQDFSAFAVEIDNLNTRLGTTISETVRAALHLKKLGGDEIHFNGDLFHVRGKLKPSVLNPVKDMFAKLIKAGFKISAIPGNHDLEKNHATRAGNSITALEDVGVTIYQETTKIGNKVFIPWQPSIDALLDELRKHAGMGYDAFIHAPVDGVLPHIPATNLTPDMLHKLGYGRVFSGHYHNHVDFGNGVYSVGALTHQTWGDIDSLAGYLIVTEDEVTHFETKAPKFVELSGEEDESELGSIVKGNFVSVRINNADPDEIAGYKKDLTDLGAAGVIVKPIRTTKTSRKGVVASTKSISLEQSLTDYIKLKGFSDAAATEAHKILGELT